MHILKFSATPTIVYFYLALLLSRPNSRPVSWIFLLATMLPGLLRLVSANMSDIANASGLQTIIPDCSRQVQYDLSHTVILRYLLYLLRRSPSETRCNS